MALIKLKFAVDPKTTGIRVNDNVYYIDSSVTNADMNDVIHIGTVAYLDVKGIHVDTASLNFAMPTASDYVFFSKNNELNMSEVLGYYAEVKFVNDSTSKAELFATTAEISSSSK